MGLENKSLILQRKNLHKRMDEIRASQRRWSLGSLPISVVSIALAFIVSPDFVGVLLIPTVGTAIKLDMFKDKIEKVDDKLREIPIGGPTV